MRRFGVILIILLGCATHTFSQFRAANNPNRQSRQSDDSQPMNKFYFGGGGGFGAGTSAGTRYVYYSLLPIVGYRVTRDFSVGTTFNYQHYNYPDYHVSYTQSGFGPFARYNFNPLFFMTEFDFINAPTVDQTTGQPETTRKLFNRWLFGLGYSSPMGRKSSINVMAMYDVLYRYPSPFSSPFVFRVFFSFL